MLHGDVAELVSIDNGTIAPGQFTSEYGVTIAMQDSSGPFDQARVNAAESERIMSEEFAKAVEKDVGAQEQE